MGWELIGGDPAPGSPESVRSASTALSGVARIASQARADLVRQTGAAGIEHWKGSAADAFRADVHKLPGDLQTVDTSYSEAAAGLSSFRAVLEKAQSDARGILAVAERAKADKDSADMRLRTAQSEVEALTVSHLRDEASLKALQAQQALTIDPAQRAGLTAPINSARTRAARTGADLNSAKQAVVHYAQLVREAQGRLDQAHRNADAVRQTVAVAVDRAVSTLQQAERDAHLPSFWSETAQQAQQLLQKYGPEVIKVLDIAQTVFSVLAMIPTPLSGVFAGAALACGIGALALSFAVDATRTGGLTGHDMFDLGGRLLGVVAGGAALKAAKLGVSGAEGASLFKNASTWKTISTVAGDAQDTLGIVQEGVEHGWRGAVVGAGGYLLGKGAEFGVAKGATSTAKFLNAVDENGAFKHPKAAAFLEQQSRDLRSGADGNPLNVTRSDDVHTLQSVMATGRETGGQFLPGNHAATNYTPNDQMMSGRDLTDEVEDGTGSVLDLGETALDGQIDDLKDVARQALGEPKQPPPGPETDIDIDLAPSPYGKMA